MIINLVRNYLFQPKILIDNNTPDDVLYFLVETCGKKISYKDIADKRQRIIDFIKNYSYKINTEELSAKNLLQISCFVSNKKSKWTKDKLLDTLNYINQFNKEKEWRDFGDITPMENNNLDISMLYYLCSTNNIEVERNDTYNDMKYKYSEYLCSELERKEMISEIILKLNSMRKEDLFSVLNNCKHSSFFVNNECSENKNYDTSYLMSNSCLDNNASIAYGIKIYGIDLSESNHPLKDLHLLSQNKISGQEFFPHNKDSEFYKNYIKNKKYFNINKFWKSKYSSLYNNKNKAEIQKYECCDFSLLDERYSSKSFYDEDNNIISYGVLGQERIFKNEQELIEIIQEHNYFKQLDGENLIDYNIVEKLYNIAEDNAMEDLKNEIKRVRKLSIDNFPVTKKFLENYIYNSENVDKIFKEIQYYCFLLRGWKKDETKPLKKENTFRDTLDEDIKQSYERIKILENNLSNTEFKNLLCVKYIDKDNIKYTKIKLSELIIPDKLEENIDYTTIILYTCYYYNKLCNGKIIFDVEELEYIN